MRMTEWIPREMPVETRKMMPRACSCVSYEPGSLGMCETFRACQPCGEKVRVQHQGEPFILKNSGCRMKPKPSTLNQLGLWDCFAACMLNPDAVPGLLTPGCNLQILNEPRP